MDIQNIAAESDEEALEWSRGDKLITDDGSITARRLTRGEAAATAAQGETSKPGAHDDVELELRGDVAGTSFMSSAVLS